MLKNIKIKVHVVGAPNSIYSASWINITQEKIMLVNNLSDADIVVFTGGADIEPEWYGETVGMYTYPSADRNSFEWKEMEKAVMLQKFIVGICRGGQMITAKAGGKLIQHVSHHHGTHLCYSHNEAKKNNILSFSVNSIHHQMCFPYHLEEKDYEILLFSLKKDFSDKSFTYLNGKNNETEYDNSKLKDVPGFMEPELIWYPKINGFAIQYHPELMDRNTFQEALTFTNIQLRRCFLLWLRNVKNMSVSEIKELITNKKTVNNE